MKTVRFWVWENDGPVRLTLRAGQELRWHRFARHDEGWSSLTRHWRFDAEDQRAYQIEVSDGRDCDGRLRQHCESSCIVTRLGGGPRDEDHPGVVYPAWERVSASQRDYAAEAMGY